MIARNDLRWIWLGDRVAEKLRSSDSAVEEIIKIEEGFRQSLDEVSIKLRLKTRNDPPAPTNSKCDRS